MNEFWFYGKQQCCYI